MHSKTEMANIKLAEEKVSKPTLPHATLALKG
jgi:hypothetical protein